MMLIHIADNHPARGLHATKKPRLTHAHAPQNRLVDRATDREWTSFAFAKHGPAKHRKGRPR